MGFRFNANSISRRLVMWRSKVSSFSFISFQIFAKMLLFG